MTSTKRQGIIRLYSILWKLQRVNQPEIPDDLAGIDTSPLCYIFDILASYQGDVLHNFNLLWYLLLYKGQGEGVIVRISTLIH